MTRKQRYVIISPVRDEARFVHRTLASIAAQTVRPALWVIVDDGSTDGTREIVERFAREHEWVQVTGVSADARRQTGSRVVRNFQVGYEWLRGRAFDFVIKLDCDLDIPPDYFERLLARFGEDPQLGIASGVYLENRGGQWTPIEMPPYHTAGAMKMVRAQCYEDIGGFVASPGWDAVDEIKAHVKGWTTRHYTDLRVLHLKDEGSGIGFRRMNQMSGEIHYLTGGGPLFFAAKFLHRAAFGRPRVLGALAMLQAYGRCVVSRRPKLVSAEEARYYRRMLNRRMFAGMTRRFGVKPTAQGARFA